MELFAMRQSEVFVEGRLWEVESLEVPYQGGGLKGLQEETPRGGQEPSPGHDSRKSSQESHRRDRSASHGGRTAAGPLGHGPDSLFGDLES